MCAHRHNCIRLTRCSFRFSLSPSRSFISNYFSTNRLFLNPFKSWNRNVFFVYLLSTEARYSFAEQGRAYTSVWNVYSGMTNGINVKVYLLCYALIIIIIITRILHCKQIFMNIVNKNNMLLKIIGGCMINRCIGHSCIGLSILTRLPHFTDRLTNINKCL